MNRRTVLASVSAGLVGGLGGCLGETPPSGDDEPGAGTPGSDDTGTDMRLSLAGVDDGPDSLAFAVDVGEDRLTSNTVPLLDITVENTGDETATWLYAPTSGVSEIVFPCRHATPDKLVIGLESEVTRLLVEGAGCARAGTGIDRAQAPVEAELAPGETLQQRYAIAGYGPELDGVCPPATTYRIDCPYEDHGRWGLDVDLLPDDR